MQIVLSNADINFEANFFDISRSFGMYLAMQLTNPVQAKQPQPCHWQQDIF